jgi:ABC-type glycerol-3-phosphate transport system permease component
MAIRRRRLVGTHIFLVLMAVWMAWPLVFMISTAFKPLDEMFLYPPRFFVIHPTLSNFADLLMAAAGTLAPPTRYLFNSVLVTAVTISLIMLVQSMAAYPLAKLRFPGRTAINVLTMAAFMFSTQVTDIPRFLVVNALHMTDTYAALIIPVVAQPFMLFLLSNYMAQVPESLLEAARIDGAGGWFIYRRIMLPMVKPALFTVLILTIISVWYDSVTPMIYLRHEVLKTLPIMLGQIGGGAGTVARTGASAAATLLMAAPTIVIFVFVQRNVLQTMAYSGIKE